MTFIKFERMRIYAINAEYKNSLRQYLMTEVDTLHNRHSMRIRSRLI